MSQKIFEALIELSNDFGSGNDLQHNTKTNTVYRGAKYHAYKDELIEALDTLNDKFKVQIDKSDELAVNLTFYQTNVKQTTRATKDLDNMEKPTLDAMQVALGFDDSQIVKKVSQKQSNFTRALRIEMWKDGAEEIKAQNPWEVLKGEYGIEKVLEMRKLVAMNVND